MCYAFPQCRSDQDYSSPGFNKHANCQNAKGNYGYVHTETISYRYRTGLILERKSLLFTLLRSVIVPVLGPVHTGTPSYRSVAFRVETSKRKSDMSTNFKHCRIRSTFYLKFNKHEKK